MADWSQQAKWILEDGWEANWSARRIAEELQLKCNMTLTTRAVIAAARRNNLPRRSSTHFVPSQQASNISRPSYTPFVKIVPICSNPVPFMENEKGCTHPVTGRGTSMMVCGAPRSKHGGDYCDMCAAYTHKHWPPRKGKLPDTPSAFNQ